MRIALLPLLFSAVAFAHGESGRSAPPPSGTAPTIVIRHGGVGGDGGSRGGNPVTKAGKGDGNHTWRMWWSYNREYLLALRTRGRPVSGTPLQDTDRVPRKELREGMLNDVILAALADKSHSVRAAAAIALGKFGDPAFDRPLGRRTKILPEKWFDVREAAVYGQAILGLTENRQTMTAIAGDADRHTVERGMALVGYIADKSEESLDLLDGHLNFQKSSVSYTAEVVPARAEAERRRVAAHLLGFARADRYDHKLMRAALGSRKWDAGVQGLAVTALGRRRARDYVKDLFRLAADRTVDKQVRRSVPIALGSMIHRGDEFDVERLAHLVRDHRKDSVLQNFTVMALAEVGGPTAIAQLTKFLRDKVFANPKDRAFVYLALGICGRGSKEARGALLGEYRSSRQGSERSVLALACSLAGIQDAVDMTLKHLEKASLGDATKENGGGFLAWGSLALGLHRDRKAVPRIKEVLRKYGDANVRENAAIALVLLDRDAAVPHLLEMLRETGTMFTRAAIVTAFSNLSQPSRQVIQALIEVYKDDVVADSVRAMAIAALGSLGDPRAIPLSAALTRNYNYFIRSATLDELARYL